MRHSAAPLSESGAALVELSLIAVVLIVVSIITIEFGSALYYRQILTQIAYELSRSASSLANLEVSATGIKGVTCIDLSASPARAKCCADSTYCPANREKHGLVMSRAAVLLQYSSIPFQSSGGVAPYSVMLELDKSDSKNIVVRVSLTATQRGFFSSDKLFGFPLKATGLNNYLFD